MKVEKWAKNWQMGQNSQPLSSELVPRGTFADVYAGVLAVGGGDDAPSCSNALVCGDGGGDALVGGGEEHLLPFCAV